MKTYEEMNQRFRCLLKSIENNNTMYFQTSGSIFNSYVIRKDNKAYSIKVLARLPKSIIVMIEAAFLDAYSYFLS